MAENPEGGAAQESGGYDYKRLHSYPLIRVSCCECQLQNIEIYNSEYCNLF